MNANTDAQDDFAIPQNIHEHVPSAAGQAAAVAELWKLLNPKSAYQQAYQKSRAEVPAAVAQLKGSERGCQALADFRVLLKNGGDGLDYKNWAALAALVHGGLTQHEIDTKLNSTLFRSARGRQAAKDIITLFDNGVTAWIPITARRSIRCAGRKGRASFRKALFALVVDFEARSCGKIRIIMNSSVLRIWCCERLTDTANCRTYSACQLSLASPVFLREPFGRPRPLDSRLESRST